MRVANRTDATDRRVPTAIFVPIHPIINRGNESSLPSVGMPVAVFVLEVRPQRFGWAVVPTLSGRAHRLSQPVSRAGLSGQPGGERTTAIGMQDRGFKAVATGGHGVVDGGGERTVGSPLRGCGGVCSASAREDGASGSSCETGTRSLRGPPRMAEVRAKWE